MTHNAALDTPDPACATRQPMQLENCFSFHIPVYTSIPAMMVAAGN
jgi:hypothetical protein